MTARRGPRRTRASPHRPRLPNPSTPQGRPHFLQPLEPPQSSSDLDFGDLDLGEVTAKSPPNSAPHRPQAAAPGVAYRAKAPRPPPQPAPATIRIFALSTFEPFSLTAGLPRCSSACVFGGRLLS